MSKTYFAEDGNYGSVNEIVIVDTENWTDEDWASLDEVSDWERPALAERIARKHGAKRWQVWYRDYESGSRMPLEYSPLFNSHAEAQAWIDDPERSWDVSVWVEEADFCAECWETVGNSVTEEVNGRTVCHSCLTAPVTQ